MKRMTRRGATVELAISAAIEALGVKRNEVEVEVIEPGKKGFLGFGAKEAEVTVTTIQVDEPSVPIENEFNKETEVVSKTEEEYRIESNEHPISTKQSDQEAIDETEEYLIMVASGMGIEDLKVSRQVDGKYITFHLDSDKAAILIGKRGQTLNALQQLAQLITNKTANQFKVVRVDVADYRQRREQSLEQLAERMADRAVRTGQKVQLEPMPSYERKVIHNALSNRLDIETFSEGIDPYRYLVIESVR